MGVVARRFRRHRARGGGAAVDEAHRLSSRLLFSHLLASSSSKPEFARSRITVDRVGCSIRREPSNTQNARPVDAEAISLSHVYRSIAITLLTLFGLSAMNLPAGAQECGPARRQLTVTNASTQPIWIAGGGAALRSVCVVSDSESCLAKPSTIVAATGACQCGTDDGTLACPATSQPIGPSTNSGLNCQCSTDADCGPTARCNTSVNECYFVLPAAKSPAPFNWKLPPTKSATFCVASASVNWQSTTIP